MVNHCGVAKTCTLYPIYIIFYSVFVYLFSEFLYYFLSYSSLQECCPFQLFCNMLLFPLFSKIINNFLNTKIINLDILQNS